MWCKNDKKKEFLGGKNDYTLAAQIAEKCDDFKLDDEDELVTDEPKSCYNCRYRRWTEESFTCCKLEK
jgi:hypothetical protein